MFTYGGTERVIWDLGKALTQAGHRVSYLVPVGSHCDFAKVLPLREDLTWEQQIPDDVDLVHFQFNPGVELKMPYLMTQHGNNEDNLPLPRNTVFVSKDHAQRHGSNAFVYNGLDWSNYGAVDWLRPRSYFHFLGKAAWRVKNVQGAIDTAYEARTSLAVLGGNRFNFKSGLRLTLSRHVSFHGMVGGAKKLNMLNGSRGLVFPVLWHEPFGLAVIESMYFGAPVFATPYGALPEIVNSECGLLSASRATLAEGLKSNTFDPYACHERALNFNANSMATHYLSLYREVCSGRVLHAAPPALRGRVKDLPWNM